MSNGIPRVQPGEVISSHLINQILDRLDALESGTTSPRGPRIDRFEPPAEQSINRVLEVFGENFAFPPAQNIVTIDGTRIVDFEPSQTDLLRFRIPFVAGAPRVVTLRIENVHGSTSVRYRITPEEVVIGDPPRLQSVTRPNGNTTLQVGQPIVITGENFGRTPSANRLRISSRVVASEIYDITEISQVDTSTDPERIEARLPDDIVIHNPEFDRMLLRLQVGAHDEVTLDVTRVTRP